MKKYQCLAGLLMLLLVACGKDRDDDRYSLLGHHWVESTRTVNGKAVETTQLQHVFFNSGYQGKMDYQYICGVVGDDCLPGQRSYGSWQLLSDSTLSTQVNGAIRIYGIERLT
ncbi:MAG TPA: hypothetical protein VIR29_03665, partial [Anseongella sp.]